MIRLLCVLVVQGLLVTGFPAGQAEDNAETISADVPSLVPVPESIAEFNEPASASDSVASSGSYESEQETVSVPTTTILKNGESENEQTNLSDTLVNEPTTVDSIVPEKEEEPYKLPAIVDKLADSKLEDVDNILTQDDKLVDSKLEDVDNTLTQPSLKNANDTNKIDSAIPELLELQSNIASELLTIKDVIESEMESTRERIKSAVLENKDAAEAKLVTTSVQSEQEKLPNMTQTKSSVESEANKDVANPITVKTEYEPFSVKEQEIEAKLVQINEFIETELAKVDAFVESELAKTEALIKSEVDKVNSFVESKLPTSLVKLGLNEQESDEESESAPEVPVGGFVEFNGIAPASGRTMIFGSTGYTPMSPTLEENAEERVKEEAVTEMAEEPVAKEVMFNGRVPVFGRTMIFGNTGFLHPNLAPLKNLNSAPPKVTKDCPKSIPISVQSSPVILGNTESGGVSRKSETTNSSEFSRNFPIISKFSKDFPETVIMDSTKNYERLLEDDEIKSHELDNFDGSAYPVFGEVFFEGKAPAFGSVSITGHC